MSSLTEAEIDALFLEEEVPDTALSLSEDSEAPSAAVKLAAEVEINALFLEEDKVRPTKLFLSEDSETLSAAVKLADTFSPFNTLPAELRNLVYSQYFSEYFTSNPSIKINAHGEIVKPPLTYVSTEIRKETDRYFTTHLTSHKNDLSIAAQITDYNLLALPTRLLALSNALGTPYRTLFRHTHATFHGLPSFPNLQAYITKYLADPMLYPSYEDTITTPLPGFRGGVGPFTSEVSLNAVMTTWERFHYARREGGAFAWKGDSVKWRDAAQRFLEEAESLGLSPGRVRG
jgi:hypothetical protein